MYLTFDFLNSFILRDIDTETYSNPNFSFYPSSVTLFDSNTTPTEGAVNIGHVSELPEKLPAYKTETCLICIKDKPFNEECVKNRSINISLIGVPDSYSIPELFNLVHAPFDKLFNSMDSLIDFTVLASKSLSNNELLAQASSILDCSVALLNPSFRVLGNYVLPGTNTKAWEIIQDKFYYPDTNVISLLHPTTITVLDSEKNIVTTNPEFFPESGDAFLIINSTSLPHLILGYLLVHYTSKMHFISLMDILHFMGAAFSYRLWHNINSATNRNSSASFMLKNILHNPSITNEEVKRQMANIDLKLPGQLVMVVVGSSYSTSSVPLNQLLTVFNSMWPNDIVFSHEADIVAVISNFQNLDSHAFFTELGEKLDEYDLYAGVCLPFTGIGKLLYNRYARTKAAAQVARIWKHNPRYLNYNDVAMFHYVQAGCRYESQKSLVDPELIKMLDMDKSKGTEYTYTLKAYWHFNQDINQTCEFLHIHRNTLFYRLKRIREILGQDINIIQASISLRLSISILETLGEDEVSIFPPNYLV